MTEKAKAKVKGKATPKSKKSPATNYSAPNLFLIATEVTPVEPVYMPVYVEPLVADVKVIVPYDSTIKSQTMRLNHRSTVVFDTGVNIKLPAGFKLNGAAKREWAVRGLFVPQAFLESDGRLKLVVVNIGVENPLVLTHQMSFAQIWLEPVYYFDWSK